MQRDNLVSNKKDPADSSDNPWFRELLAILISYPLSAGIFYYGLYNNYLDHFGGFKPDMPKNPTFLNDQLWAFLGTGAFNLIFAVIAIGYLQILIEYLVNLSLFMDNKLLRRIGHYVPDEKAQLKISWAITGVAAIIGVFVFTELLNPDYF